MAFQIFDSVGVGRDPTRIDRDMNPDGGSSPSMRKGYHGIPPSDQLLWDFLWSVVTEYEIQGRLTSELERRLPL